MISIPTVDQLIDSALNADSPVLEQQKVAAARDESEKIDEMEKVASKLESWADGIESEDQEQVKVASAEKYESARQRMLKLAMVGTAYRTLKSLEENGQLDTLVEKNAQVGKWLIGRARRGLGAVVAKPSKVREAAKAIAGRPPLTGVAKTRAVARQQKRMAAAGAAIAERRPATIRGRAEVALAKSRQQAAQARRATTAAKATAAKQVAEATRAREAAEVGRKRMALVAGGAGAAGLAGAGLAYGAGRKQERQRQARRYA
jgi:hypothetical protein